MQTIDLKTMHKHLFSASAKTPALVEVPRLKFLRIDGAIEPGHAPGDSPLFQENIQAIYGAAFTLKFMLKKRAVNPIDYPLLALEGLWWVEDGKFDIQIKDNWFYTLQILQPEVISQELLAGALAELRKKRGSQPAFERLRVEEFEEGRCVQMMHIGAYASEPETVAKMEAFAAAHGLRFCRVHHEIYMGDPRRADASRLKTILRHPVTE